MFCFLPACTKGSVLCLNGLYCNAISLQEQTEGMCSVTFSDQLLSRN